MISYAGLRHGLIIGIVSGSLWGIMALLFNSIAGALPMENTLAHNLAAFTIAGALIGAIAGGFLSFIDELLPFKTVTLKAIFVTTALWFVLLLGGVVMSLAEQGRYHYSPAETSHGLILAILLGITLGLIWKRKPNLL
ncbi:MAG: hypothetical protein HY880_01490 [Deltaproteobacteria bacterium]|nr:hypothetical protein [Deltaproteobacteria bacterium]